MYSQQNVGIGDDYVTAHRLDRRLAVIDRFYLTNVTNRAFNDYFGNTSYGCLTEFVHPDDKEKLIELIEVLWVNAFYSGTIRGSTDRILLSFCHLRIMMLCVILI